MNTITNIDSNALVSLGFLNVGLQDANNSALKAFCFEQAVLIVNDMQPGFEAAKDSLTIYAVRKQVKAAMALNLRIVLVEYDAHEMGHTLPEIMQLVEGYKHLLVASKSICRSLSKDDGSLAILKAIYASGIMTEDFILCGVNSDACIKDTVNGLVQWLPQCRILLPQDACNSVNGKDCSVWHNEFKLIANVVLQMHSG